MLDRQLKLIKKLPWQRVVLEFFQGDWPFVEVELSLLQMRSDGALHQCCGIFKRKMRLTLKNGMRKAMGQIMA